MKKVAIYYSVYTPVVDAIKHQVSDTEFADNPDTSENFDLCVQVHYNKKSYNNAIEVHHSLLPAFDTQTPVKDAFISGVKVTGITFYYTNTKKIIAQYPIFISNDSHYDEIEAQLSYLEQMLYPIIVKKILNNEPFEINSLINNNAGKCGGCCGCKH